MSQTARVFAAICTFLIVSAFVVLVSSQITAYRAVSSSKKSAASSVRSNDALQKVVADKNDQVTALQRIRDEAFASRDQAVQSAAVERDQKVKINCVQFDRLNSFATVIASLIVANPMLTAQQRATIEPFARPAPRPVGCPPKEQP